MGWSWHDFSCGAGSSLLVGQIKSRWRNLSSPSGKNKSLGCFAKSALWSAPFRCVGGDVSRSSRTSAAERDGRLGSQRDHLRRRTIRHARSSRAVLIPRCWYHACDGAHASRGQRWPTSPAHRGEREAAVKTIAQGGPGVFGQTCGTCRLHFLSRRATGAASARPSLHPPRYEGDAVIKARTQHAPRDRGGSSAHAVCNDQ